MSDFLAAEGIPALSGLPRRAHHRRPRSRRRRQRDLARQSRARRSPRSEDPLLLAARGDSRALSLGRALDRHRRHARQDDDDGADRVGADRTAALDPSVLVGGIARNFGEHGSSYRIGQGRDFVIEGDEYDSAFFDKTAKFLKYLPDIAVINNVEFDHADIYADFERGDAGVPPAGQPRAAARAAAPRRRQRRRARAEGRRRVARRDVRHGRRRRLAGARSRAGRRSRRGSGCGAAGRRSARSRCRSSARTTCAMRSRRSRSRPRSASASERIAEGLRRFAGVKRRLEVVGVADGVTVYDDFAHHPTAVAETLAGLRAANPGARIWAVFEPRSASSCRRVFQDDFARAFAGADEVLIAPVFRSTLPEAERLSVPELVRDLQSRRPVGARGRLDRRHRRRASSASIGRAISSSSCRTAGSAAFTRSCCGRSRDRR